jgi:hypothetical protein
MVKNKSKAPAAASSYPFWRDIPTTRKGGTKEIAMATPPVESAISDRKVIKAPAAPGQSFQHAHVLLDIFRWLGNAVVHHIPVCLVSFDHLELIILPGV